MSSQPSEYSPLLPTQHGSASRAIALLKAEGEPTWCQSFKFYIFDSYANILLIFIPLSFLSHHLQWDAALRFSFSFLAIIPLAKLLGVSTEELSVKMGSTWAGLLNASFGNAVEIIVGVAALLQDQLRIVQTSMLGSILSNILLVLGCSFFAAGIKYKESVFGQTAAQASSSLMTLGCITMIIPAAYYSAQKEDTSVAPGILTISRGTAILLLFVYLAYLWFQLKTHTKLFEDDPRADGSAGSIDSVAPPVEELQEANMNTVAAGTSLLIVTVITSFCADYLVASIEETADRYDIPKAFIGLILLPIVANAAEHVTSIWMALKDRMELTIGICVGSSIQIAIFVVPLLVIIGWITNHDLTLFFANFETIVFFVSVFLVNTLIQDGKSNYMEGLMLITLYLVIALAFWVS